MLRPFKKAPAGNVRAGVMQDGSRVELAVVCLLDDGTLTLAAQNVASIGDDDGWDQDTGPVIDHVDLRNARVSAVLGADRYSLQLVEAPNVPAAEMQEAVRWRIQHLIEFPLDEAVVETFEMPAPANPGNRPMIYAVVVHRDEILEQVQRINDADLHMDAIDIPELCMRNVAVRLPQDADGVAFLHFTDDCGYLTITRKGVLFMVRRIETSRSDLVDPEDAELSLEGRSAEVALEIQRSLDYYESHYDCRPVTELVLGPGSNLNSLASSLADNLGITVSRLDLGNLFELKSDISPDTQSDCLLAIGAALRSDKASTRAAA